MKLDDRIRFVPANVADPTDALRRDNPLGKMPVLILDDERAVYDSRVIVETLDHLAGGGKIIPSDWDLRLSCLTAQALADGHCSTPPSRPSKCRRREEISMRARWLTSALLIFLATATAANAQTYPDHPIRLIVPFPAGGPTDIIARVVTQAMSERLGQSFVIENRGGAGGVVGTNVVAKAAPDGYTLGLSSAGALAISQSLQQMPYQSASDLTPIALIAKVPELLVVPRDLPVHTVADLVTMARAKPGGLNFASTGPGSMTHLAVELLMSAAKLDMVHVPYTGAAPAMNDLLAGRVQLMFADVPAELPYVQAGTLRALAIGSQQRIELLPDVPTTAQAGFKSVVAENWYGLIAPRRLPADLVAKLNAAAVDAVRRPDVQKTLGAQGALLQGDSPSDFSSFIDSETAKWGRVVREAGVKIE